MTNRTDNGIAKDATSLLRELLDDWQSLYDMLWKAAEEPSPEDRQRIYTRQVDLFGSAYMLAVVRHLDPVRADRAAAFLAEMWDAGDSLGEWVYEWREQLAAGKPLTLLVDNAEEVPAS